MDVLRGSAHRQRATGHPPHRVAHVQGRLPAVPDDAGLPGQPQGRLGLPRAPGRARRREGARLLRQGRHRGLRDRGVQRPLPRVGAPPRRPLGRDDRPDGLLDRHAQALPHDGPGVRRVGLVGAEADPRQGPAAGGLPRRAVLPPRRDDALRPRARAGLRDRHRPLGLRALPADLRPVRRLSRISRGLPARLDDDSVDARLQRADRRPPGDDLRDRQQRRGDPRRRRVTGAAGAGRGMDHR